MTKQRNSITLKKSASPNLQYKTKEIYENFDGISDERKPQNRNHMNAKR